MYERTKLAEFANKFNLLNLSIIKQRQYAGELIARREGEWVSAVELSTESELIRFLFRPGSAFANAASESSVSHLHLCEG